jgi:hypothetical protein
VHQVAGGFDIAFKPRGARLVISHRGHGRLHVKASDVDRRLSLKAMTDALGPFEPPAPPARATRPQTSYQRPRPSGDLYEAFQRARDAALRARADALARLAVGHRAYAGDLAAWHRQRMRR